MGFTNRKFCFFFFLLISPSLTIAKLERLPARTVVIWGRPGIAASEGGPGWCCLAETGHRAPGCGGAQPLRLRRAVVPAPALCAPQAGVFARGEWGLLPGADPYQVGVGALKGHGSRVTAQDAHHPTGQLLDALQDSRHDCFYSPPARGDSSAALATRPVRGRRRGGAGSRLTSREPGGRGTRQLCWGRDRRSRDTARTP